MRDWRCATMNEGSFQSLYSVDGVASRKIRIYILHMFTALLTSIRRQQLERVPKQHSFHNDFQYTFYQVVLSEIVRYWNRQCLPTLEGQSKQNPTDSKVKAWFVAVLCVVNVAPRSDGHRMLETSCAKGRDWITTSFHRYLRRAAPYRNYKATLL